MESSLLSNTMYVTYVSGTNSKGQDILKTQRFTNVGLHADDKTFNNVLQAISSVIGKPVIEAGKIQKSSIED